MSDLFLNAHWYTERIFTVGGAVYPISIRDQMIRGQLLADRAFEQGLIGGPDGAPLVVVGGGAAGATAAIRSAELGVPTTLVERGPRVFATQAGCRTRWVDPVQYDWAADHYSAGSYPWHPPTQHPLALGWRADWSDRLAIAWQQRLRREVRRRVGKLQVLTRRNYRRVLAPVAAAADGARYSVEVEGPQPGQVAHLPAATVVLAMGFGEERSSLPPAHGFAFWHTDPFKDPNLGLPAGQRPTVLLSGAGDGALQDFLRIVTTSRYHSAKEIYRDCDIPESVEHELQSIQDHAQRCYNWGQDDFHDHPVLANLQRAHWGIVERIFANQNREPEYAAVVRRLEAIVRPGAELPGLLWVYPCDHFGNAYGLNRFLALLVARFLQRHRGRRDVLLPGYRLAGVECRHDPPGAAEGRAWACHGRPHKITLEHRPACWERPDPPVTRRLVAEFNVLVLRLGVALPPAVRHLSPAQFRQMLPYAVPM
jgi:hypothetical protein